MYVLTNTCDPSTPLSDVGSAQSNGVYIFLPSETNATIPEAIHGNIVARAGYSQVNPGSIPDINRDVNIPGVVADRDHIVCCCRYDEWDWSVVNTVQKSTGNVVHLHFVKKGSLRNPKASGVSAKCDESETDDPNISVLNRIVVTL